MHIHFPDRLKSRWNLFEHRLRERRWASLRGRPETFVMGLQPGLKIRLYGDSELCRLIYLRNFEAAERDFLKRFLRPGDLFIDVGANIGLFTLIAAAHVGPTGRVVAFEPTPVTYSRLLDNVRLNQFANVTCNKLALSDRSERLKLVRSTDGFDAWNSLARPTSGNACSDELIQTIEWDRYAREGNLIGSATMIKIDVEGWESRVIAGGNEVFSREDAPVLQVEFCDAAAEAAGTSCRHLYKYLESFGYRMFCYDFSKRALIEDPLREEYPYVNLMAAKNFDFVNLRLRQFDTTSVAN